MSGYPYHPIKIERDEETGALRCTVTVNLFDEYMRMIDRGIAEQGEAAMDAALEAHGYTKERIVRCRDCVHYSEHEWIIATDVSDVCHFWHGEPTKVASDGFCAWGERKAVE